MKKDKWEEIRQMVVNKFEVLDEGEVMEDGKKIEYIDFKMDLGEFRIEYVEKPRDMGVKTFYSKRAGTKAKRVERVTSKEEMVNYMKIYKYDENEDDFVEMKAGMETFLGE